MTATIWPQAAAPEGTSSREPKRLDGYPIGITIKERSAMLNKPQATLSLGLCVLLAAAPVLANPPPGKGKPGHHEGGVQMNLRGPSVDIGQVRIILGDNRQLIGPASSLPPGIAKNLARGKPLPPGIAKNLDSRLTTRLPHYDGYEWKQIGRDVVLVAIATGIVYEILRNVLD